MSFGLGYRILGMLKVGSRNQENRNEERNPGCLYGYGNCRTAGRCYSFGMYFFGSESLEDPVNERDGRSAIRNGKEW